jgi:(1->4)-alpha-D-glucan 1-alpha-D-glucosylmutase
MVMDVLENGPSSQYAPYFDIEWQPLKTDLRNRVLLPILGDQYGRVLERGELQVRFEEGTFYLVYGERRLPIAPGTYRHILEVALENLAEYKDDDFYAELQSVLTALEYLPKRTETDPKRIAERAERRKSSNDGWSVVVPSAAGTTGNRKSTRTDQRESGRSAQFR